MAQQLQRHQAFLRLGKITKGPESALIAARHNLRELPLAPNMVEGKQSLNVVLQGPGSAAAVQASYEKVLAKNGVNKLRKDAVRLIEALVSLPVGVDRSGPACLNNSGHLLSEIAGVMPSAFVQMAMLQSTLHQG